MPPSDSSDYSTNPYRSPAEAGGSPLEQLDLTPGSRIVSFLGQTRPWVRFLSVLGFIAAALMLIGSVIGLFVAAAMQGPPGSFVFIVYIAGALLYIVPSIHLFRYADRIRDLENSGRVESLELALEAQKSFWRFVGIMMAIVLVVYAVVIVIAIVVGLNGLA